MAYWEGWREQGLPKMLFKDGIAQLRESHVGLKSKLESLRQALETMDWGHVELVDETHLGSQQNKDLWSRATGILTRVYKTDGEYFIL